MIIIYNRRNTFNFYHKFLYNENKILVNKYKNTNGKGGKLMYSKIKVAKFNPIIIS